MLAFLLKLFKFPPCVPTQAILVNFFNKKVLSIQKKHLPLQRYPENNLFTLKRLIPIEDMKRPLVRVFALFFCPMAKHLQLVLVATSLS